MSYEPSIYYLSGSCAQNLKLHANIRVLSYGPPRLNTLSDCFCPLRTGGCEIVRLPAYEVTSYILRGVDLQIHAIRTQVWVTAQTLIL